MIEQKEPVALPETLGLAPLQSDRNGWSAAPPAPWRRLGARLVDTILFGPASAWLLSLLLDGTAPEVSAASGHRLATPEGRVLGFMLAVLLAGLVSGPIVGLTGSSPGKALFGVRILGTDMRPLGIPKAVIREVRVWWSGMLLGLPLAFLLSAYFAGSRLLREGATSWDQERCVVLHRPAGRLQSALSLCGLAFLAIAYWQFGMLFWV